MKRAEVSAGAGVLALAAAACVGAYRLGLGDVHSPGPGFMPFATAALLGLMALGQVARSVVGVSDGGGHRPFAGTRWSAVIGVLGALAGFGLALDTAGFSLSTFLMLAVLFGAVAGKRWWVALGLAFLVVLVTRLLLTALGIPVPEGWLDP